MNDFVAWDPRQFGLSLLYYEPLSDELQFTVNPDLDKTHDLSARFGDLYIANGLQLDYNLRAFDDFLYIRPKLRWWQSEATIDIAEDTPGHLDIDHIEGGVDFDFAIVGAKDWWRISLYLSVVGGAQFFSGSTDVGLGEKADLEFDVSYFSAGAGAGLTHYLKLEFAFITPLEHTEGLHDLVDYPAEVRASIPNAKFGMDLTDDDPAWQFLAMINPLGGLHHIDDPADGINARYDAEEKNRTIARVKDDLRRVKGKIEAGNRLVASDISDAETQARGAEIDLQSAEIAINTNDLDESDYQDRDINLATIKRDFEALNASIARAKATAATPRTPLNLSGADNSGGTTELGRLGVVKKKFEGESGYLVLITGELSTAARQVSLASGVDANKANTHLLIARTALESAQRKYDGALAYAHGANNGVNEHYAGKSEYTALRDGILTDTHTAHGDLSRAINEYNTAITAYNASHDTTDIATLSFPEAPPTAPIARTEAAPRAERPAAGPINFPKRVETLTANAERNAKAAQTLLAANEFTQAKAKAQSAQGFVTKAQALAKEHGITAFDGRIRTANATAGTVIAQANEKIDAAAAAAKAKGAPAARDEHIE